MPRSARRASGGPWEAASRHISFPLAYPAVPYFRTVTFQPTEAIATTESPFSLATQIQRHQGQLWRAQLELPPMPRKDAAAWVAWLLAQRGGAGSFLLGQVPETVPLGQATGTPRIAGSHTRGVETISTDGWTASVAGIVKAGDLFQVGAGAAARLHQILVDASSNSSGVASLEIWPRLRSDLADNTALVMANPQGLFRLAGPTVEWSVDEARFYGIAFSAVEALTV